MNSFRDVIDLWDTRVSFAADVGISPVRASAWWQRDSIPPDWWNRVIKAARDSGRRGVTLKRFAKWAEARLPEKPGEAA